MNFKRMMTAPDDKAYRDAIGRNYRHEIAALWFVGVTADSLARSYGPIPGRGCLEILAVAGHHKFLADDYLFDESKFLNRIDWEPDPCSAHQGSLRSGKGYVSRSRMETSAPQSRSRRNRAKAL